MPIGAAEYKPKEDTIVVAAQGGGTPAQKELGVVAQCGIAGAALVHWKNQGDEDVEWEVVVRGLLIAVTGESIAALRVGATDQFQGLLANTRIEPNTFSATDAGVPQTVQDDGNGNLVDAAAPATIVGSINYETGAIDFTWPAVFVGPGVTADYQHKGFVPFGTPILGTVAAGGGEDSVILMKAAGVNPADNYVDGIKGHHTLGLYATSPGQGSMLGIRVEHHGPDTDFKLVTPQRFRNLNSPLTEE